MGKINLAGLSELLNATDDKAAVQQAMAMDEEKYRVFDALGIRTELFGCDVRPDPAAEDDSFGMSLKLRAALRMWSALEVLVQRKVHIQSVAPIGDCAVRICMRLQGRLKNDPRTVGRMQGLTFSGCRIMGNAKLDFTVIVELSFDPSSATITHVRRYWCQADVMKQLHTQPQPLESQWDPKSLQAQREAALDVVVGLVLQSEAEPGDDFQRRLAQVMHDNTVLCVPDAVRMYPESNAVSFYGFDSCQRALAALATKLGLDKAFEGKTNFSKRTRWDEDWCRMSVRCEGMCSEGLLGVFKAQHEELIKLNERSDAGLASQTMPIQSASRKHFAVEFMWSFRFEANSALVKDLTWRIENYPEICESVGILPNFALYKCLAEMK